MDPQRGDFVAVLYGRKSILNNVEMAKKGKLVLAGAPGVPLLPADDSMIQGAVTKILRQSIC